MRVIFILGYERSGSTLLQNVLGQSPECFAAGELRQIWHRGLIENRRCSCGAKLTECEVWIEILNTAFGDWRKIDAPRLYSQRRLLRNRHLPTLLLPGGLSRRKRALRDYSSYTSDLVTAIGRCSGADFVVDASKSPTAAYFLQQSTSLDFCFVHIVRDPRGVAYSLKKRQQVGHEDYVNSTVFRTATEWSLLNAMIEHLSSRQAKRYLRIRYEDFTSRPLDTARAILRFAGASEEGLEGAFHDQNTVEMIPTHAFGGSPHRFTVGTLKISADDQWSVKLSYRDRRMIEMIAKPIMRRYDYAPQKRLMQ